MDIESCILKVSKIPVYKLYLVKFEIGSYRINHDVSHFKIIMNDTCFMGFV